MPKVRVELDHMEAMVCLAALRVSAKAASQRGRPDIAKNYYWAKARVQEAVELAKAKEQEEMDRA